MLDSLELEMLNVLHMVSQNLLECSNVGRIHENLFMIMFLPVIESQ